MSFSVYKLNALAYNIGEEDTQSILSSFRCSTEPAAEDFLNKTAIKHEKSGISRTYLFMNETDPGAATIKGFYSLAVKCLAIDKQNSIPEEILAQMNVNHGVAQAYLLGQLAKADGVEKGFGRMMIEHALDAFSKGNEMFGCRVVRLDCRDPLLEYYESCGFTPTGKNHSNALNQMIAII